MKTLACTLIVAAGIIVSYILISEEKERLSKLTGAVEFISFMRAQIDNFRTPMGEILNMYNASGKSKAGLTAEDPESLPRELEEMVPDGGRTLWTVREIMDGGYDDAAKGAAVLEGRAKEFFEKEKKAFDEKKKTLMILPTAACLLLVILIL